MTTIRELRLDNNLIMKNIKNDAFAGNAKLHKFEVFNNPNFADYLRSGW